jgi:prepilin-type N-terminal cleavage/methylation domain-containing protein
MKRGFTLIELLIVIAILAIMTMIMVGILNPIALMGKANDARRKKDLGRIKVAFEEYFNDNGCYPTDAVISGLTCDGSGFASWGVNSWPCDPSTRLPYYIFVGPDASCPSWYKILTNLDNKTDSQIPIDWYTPENSGYRFGDGLVNNSQVNFGVSSPNVSWFDHELDPGCINGSGVNRCYGYHAGTGFFPLNPADREYNNAYTKQDLRCLVACCFNGSLCPE